MTQDTLDISKRHTSAIYSSRIEIIKFRVAIENNKCDFHSTDITPDISL